MDDWQKESIAQLQRYIGDSIKGRRNQKYLKQEELSELSGVSVRTISNLETGNGNPSLSNLLQVLKVLDMANELQAIFWSPDESPLLRAKATVKQKKERVRKSKGSQEKRMDNWTWEEDK